MFYSTYYGGMHLIWWFAWIVLIFWIFAVPYRIPGQRFKKDTPLDLLKMLYARGAINTEEYFEKKNALLNNLKK